MTIKKISGDSLIISLFAISVFAPNVYAKQLVLFFFIFLFIKFIISKNIFYLLNTKILILILFSPGIILSLISFNEVFFRYLPVLFIVFYFPFTNFRLNFLFILLCMIFIFFYLVLTQIFLSFENELFLNFRNFWYPFEYAELFNVDKIDNPLKQIIENTRISRFGGLYYNPNTYAGILFILYLIIDKLFKYYFDNILIIKKKATITYFIINLFFIVSLLFAGSLTIMVSYILYKIITLKERKLYKKKFLNFLKTVFLFFLILLTVPMLGYELVNLGSTASFGIKLSIFYRYLEEVNLLNLLFGGTFDIFFDQEYGYWLGASGLSGLFAFFLLFKTIIKTIPSSKSLILSFLLIGFGATIFYNFMMISLVIILLIINSAIHFKNIIIK
jgi:hypothetical protein